MIPFTMSANGPDMDTIIKLVKSDESIKGIWCVPKYSNPSGVTYSDETIDALASMYTLAKDFRIFWDNAYMTHNLYEKKEEELKDILKTCKEKGHPNRPLVITSTSKMTFAGSGLCMVASSRANIESLKKEISLQTIGPDKLNQLRHLLFFKSVDGIRSHMKKHANILRPKFEIVQDVLETELGEKNIATWSTPNGGYFISVNTLEGCAKKVVEMTSQGGVSLTPAGTTFPYGSDPKDTNIRLAPSFPECADLKLATELLAISIQIVSIDKILGQ